MLSLISLIAPLPTPYPQKENLLLKWNHFLLILFFTSHIQYVSNPLGSILKIYPESLFSAP